VERPWPVVWLPVVCFALLPTADSKKEGTMKASDIQQPCLCVHGLSVPFCCHLSCTLEAWDEMDDAEKREAIEMALDRLERAALARRMVARRMFRSATYCRGVSIPDSCNQV
jgi:hypothetical protein